MDISAIPGLVQEGMARGYDEFVAVRYADSRLDPGLVIDDSQFPALGAALDARIPGTGAVVWEAIARMELGHRIAVPIAPGADGAGVFASLPGWAWALVSFVALASLSALTKGK